MSGPKYSKSDKSDFLDGNFDDFCRVSAGLRLFTGSNSVLFVTWMVSSKLRVCFSAKSNCWVVLGLLCPACVHKCKDHLLLKASCSGHI